MRNDNQQNKTPTKPQQQTGEEFGSIKGRQRGEVTATHPEHVVPCKSLAMEATRLLRGGMNFDAVQHWVQPYLVVVWIEKTQADRFDRGGDRQTSEQTEADRKQTRAHKSFPPRKS